MRNSQVVLLTHFTTTSNNLYFNVVIPHHLPSIESIRTEIMLNWSCCTQRIYSLHFNKIQPQDFNKPFLILNCTDIRPMMQLEVSTGQRQFCTKILHVHEHSLCSILLCQNGELILGFTLVIPDLIGSVLLKSSFFLAILLLFQVISWKRSHSGVEERPQVRRAYEVTTSTCDANVKNTFLLMAGLQCMIGVTQKLATFEDCCQRLQPIPFFMICSGFYQHLPTNL